MESVYVSKKNEQINIFTQVNNNGDVTVLDEFKSAHEAFEKLPKKRIHYKTAKYHKKYNNYTDIEGNIFDDTHIYGRLNAIYTQLANAFPFLFQQEKYVEIGMLRCWKVEYVKEEYTHKGISYMGQNFTVRQAEVIGTEDLSAEARLFIHSEVLNALDEGYSIEQMNMWLEEFVNYFKQGFRACDVLLALILCPNCNEIQ